MRDKEVLAYILVKYFPSGGLKKLPVYKFFKSWLWQVYWYQQLSLAENNIHIKRDQILSIF